MDDRNACAVTDEQTEAASAGEVMDADGTAGVDDAVNFNQEHGGCDANAAEGAEADAEVACSVEADDMGADGGEAADASAAAASFAEDAGDAAGELAAVTPEEIAPATAEADAETGSNCEEQPACTTTA
jgi:hypothetical protein